MKTSSQSNQFASKLTNLFKMLNLRPQKPKDFHRNLLHKMS